MPEVTPDVQAAPSPAVEAPQQILDRMTSDQRADWRKTGAMPEVKPTNGEAAPPDTSKETPVSASASEADPQDKPKKRDDAASRLQEILADLKTAGLSPKELKTFKRDATAVIKADSAPAKAIIPAKAEPVLEMPVKPKREDFADWDKYEAAKDKWTEDMADIRAKRAVSEDRTARKQEQDMARMQSELDVGRQRYKEFDTVINPVLSEFLGKENPVDPVVMGVMGTSPYFVDLMYVIGEKPEAKAEFMHLARTNPFEAIRRAVLMESLIAKELSGKSENTDSKRGENGQFQATPEKKVTGAPPPPTEVGGKGTAPVDEMASIAKIPDEQARFAAYKAKANRDELARRKAAN